MSETFEKSQLSEFFDVSSGCVMSESLFRFVFTKDENATDRNE